MVYKAHAYIACAVLVMTMVRHENIFTHIRQLHRREPSILFYMKW